MPEVSLEQRSQQLMDVVNHGLNQALHGNVRSDRKWLVMQPSEDHHFIDIHLDLPSNYLLGLKVDLTVNGLQLSSHDFKQVMDDAGLPISLGQAQADLALGMMLQVCTLNLNQPADDDSNEDFQELLADSGWLVLVGDLLSQFWLKIGDEYQQGLDQYVFALNGLADQKTFMDLSQCLATLDTVCDLLQSDEASLMVESDPGMEVDIQHNQDFACQFFNQKLATLKSSFLASLVMFSLNNLMDGYFPDLDSDPDAEAVNQVLHQVALTYLNLMTYADPKMIKQLITLTRADDSRVE